MRSSGADHVIDYTQEDFAKNGQHYDRIIDVAATRSVFDYKRTVSEIARQHGFWHMGQFSADYKKIFTELPSKTLKAS